MIPAAEMRMNLNRGSQVCILIGAIGERRDEGLTQVSGSGKKEQMDVDGTSEAEFPEDRWDSQGPGPGDLTKPRHEA